MALFGYGTVTTTYIAPQRKDGTNYSAKAGLNKIQMAQIIAIKNRMSMLSIKTRDAWLAFKKSVYEDIDAQILQGDLLRQGNPVKNETESRKKLKQQIAARGAYLRDKEKLAATYTCVDCKDRGFKHVVDRNGGSFSYPCTCPQAKIYIWSDRVELLKDTHPNWTHSDDYNQSFCSNCSGVFSAPTIHKCLNA
jgi:hypothetical protein